MQQHTLAGIASHVTALLKAPVPCISHSVKIITQPEEMCNHVPIERAIYIHAEGLVDLTPDGPELDLCYWTNSSADISESSWRIVR